VKGPVAVWQQWTHPHSSETSHLNTIETGNLATRRHVSEGNLKVLKISSITSVTIFEVLHRDGGLPQGFHFDSILFESLKNLLINPGDSVQSILKEVENFKEYCRLFKDAIDKRGFFGSVLGKSDVLNNFKHRK